MAKKVRRRTSRAEVVEHPIPSFDEKFPAITRWISQEEGWIELGADHRSRSLARALYGGGMAWEGTKAYGSLDEALRAMDAGIVAWLAEVRPDVDQGEAARKKPSSARPVRSPSRKKSPPKSPPKREDRVKADASPSIPRPIVEKVRKFADIAGALRHGQHFEITRLTSLKGLCEDVRAARKFAMFLAVHARKRAEEKKATHRVKVLVDAAIKEMKSYLEEPAKERKEPLYSLLREIEREQDEYERHRWGLVRVVSSRELLVVEKALRSILREDEAPTWLYRAARDYAERYDSRYGTGLIPASAPMVQDIADFWRMYQGIER